MESKPKVINVKFLITKEYKINQKEQKAENKEKKESIILFKVKTMKAKNGNEDLDSSQLNKFKVETTGEKNNNRNAFNNIISKKKKFLILKMKMKQIILKKGGKL